jgi:hypothetical protein
MNTAKRELGGSWKIILKKTLEIDIRKKSPLGGKKFCT